jgi:hypothetical protein
VAAVSAGSWVMFACVMFAWICSEIWCLKKAGFHPQGLLQMLRMIDFQLTLALCSDVLLLLLLLLLCRLACSTWTMCAPSGTWTLWTLTRWWRCAAWSRAQATSSLTSGARNVLHCIAVLHLQTLLR